MDEDLRWAVETLDQVVARLEGLLEPEPTEPLDRFVVYSQRNNWWAGDRLGPDVGGGTIRGEGCAATSAAMVATWAGCAVTPGELNRWLSDHGGFFAEKAGGPRNLLWWTKVTEFCAGLRYGGKRSWHSQPADVELVRRLLEQGPVVAEVDFDHRDLDVDQHFVVLLRFVDEDEVEIADPWDGERVGLVERYYNPAWPAPRGKVARVVTGLRVLVAK